MSPTDADADAPVRSGRLGPRIGAGLKPRGAAVARRATGLSDEDREFLSPARSIRETPPSPVRMALAAAICALVTLALLVGFIGRLDIYAEAPGRIQPIGRSKVIQPLDAGKIIRMNVRDGDQVHAGEVLAELDPTDPAATEATALGKQGQLSAEVARRRTAGALAEAGRFPAAPTPDYPPEAPADLRARETAVLRADLDQLSADLGALRARAAESAAQAASARAAISAHRQTLGTLGQRVDIRARLQREGWESRANVLDVQEDVDRERTALAQAQGELASALASGATARSQIAQTTQKFVDDNAQAMRDAQNKLDQADQDLIKARSALQHTRLISPDNGVVQQLSVTTPGQVVSSGQQLMTIVPSGAPLEIEADMQNKDIGFVRVGQPAVIKVEAFPFSRYGVLTGRVTRVSRDAVTSQEASQNTDTRAPSVNPQQSSAAPTAQVSNLVYPVTVRLDRPFIRVDGRDMRLAPGMSVTVEVKTGTRRAISYLLSPFVEVTAEAGHER